MNSNESTNPLHSEQPRALQGAQTLAEALGLPAGYKAERYISGVLIEIPWSIAKREGATAFIPDPYSVQPMQWWQDQARAALATLA